MWIFVALGCFLVGLLIGWSGIAGFLLPILFMNGLERTGSESLFLSFLCFLLSGIIGASGSYKRGEISLRPALALSAGSFFGAMIGAWAGRVISTENLKLILYLVVLFSGISILVRDRMVRDSGSLKKPHSAKIILVGFLTAILCAMTGAGGPVLTMPILILMGYSPKESVGLALFDSVFIAIPAIFFYGSASGWSLPAALVLALLLIHGSGVLLGSKTSGIISQVFLKRSVACFSIGFSLIMLMI